MWLLTAIIDQLLGSPFTKHTTDFSVINRLRTTLYNMNLLIYCRADMRNSLRQSIRTFFTEV